MKKLLKSIIEAVTSEYVLQMIIFILFILAYIFGVTYFTSIVESFYK